MRISKSTLIILVFVVSFSVFIANVFNLFNTQIVYDKNVPNNTKENQQRLKITDSANHLIWFVQITDIHISIFHDPTRITQLREFCDYTVNVIKPRVVLASGDLTDAKTYDSRSTQQFEDEWKHYRNTLEECKALEKTVWLDIRGNHDSFNVAGFNSKQNFFTNYSVQGRKHPRSYIYQTREGGELYSFIGVDACLEPGLKGPFNFIGTLDDVEVDEINRLIKQTEITGSNYSIWFGHFPTSCILSPWYGEARNLIGRDKRSLVYVCGHLHTVGGFIPKMYTLQQQGFLELELGDWKDNRIYRIMAVDHGMFSFVDVHHGQWPVVLITNPKHTLFLIPKTESVQTIKESTHIRILAFSLSDITKVEMKIDNENWTPCRYVSGPLYVAPWDPNKYSNGLHYIRVRVKDYDGREQLVSQPFSLDDTRLSFEFLSRIALMSDATTNLKIMFATMVAMTILPLCLLRYVHKRTKEKKISMPLNRGGCCNIWLRKLWMLSAVDLTFWPVVLYPLYVAFGPWSIGYLVEDHIGIVFLWGIFVDGTFLPGPFTFAFGLIQMFTFHVLLIFILAHGVDVSFRHHETNSSKRKTVLTLISLYLPFSVILAMQIWMACFFWVAHGMLAFLLGFLTTWSVVLTIVLWYFVLHLPPKYLREIAIVWGKKVDPQGSKATPTIEDK